MTGRERGRPAPGAQVSFGERFHDPFFWSAVKKRLGYLALGLVLLAAFGAVGIFSGYVIVTTVRDAYRAPDWPQVPATVLGIGEGGASYTYEYLGKKYTSDRLGSFWVGGTSDVDDWDARMGSKLTAALESGKPLTAFVNPGNPRDAMLDHELRWKLLLFFVPFALGFGIVGVAGFLFFVVKALGLERRSSQPVFKPKTREMFTQWGFGILWNAISVPIALLAIPEMWAKGEWFPVILISIFPLIGALVVWGALITTWHVIRAGNPFNPLFFEDMKHS
jgi:hypothetical protein